MQFYLGKNRMAYQFSKKQSEHRNKPVIRSRHELGIGLNGRSRRAGKEIVKTGTS